MLVIHLFCYIMFRVELSYKALAFFEGQLIIYNALVPSSDVLISHDGSGDEKDLQYICCIYGNGPA